MVLPFQCFLGKKIVTDIMSKGKNLINLSQIRGNRGRPKIAPVAGSFKLLPSHQLLYYSLLFFYLFGKCGLKSPGAQIANATIKAMDSEVVEVPFSFFYICSRATCSKFMTFFWDYICQFWLGKKAFDEKHSTCLKEEYWCNAE